MLGELFEHVDGVRLVTDLFIYFKDQWYLKRCLNARFCETELTLDMNG